LSYVLCQLSSKPTDQNHVTSVKYVNKHCLTHIVVISPVLEKKYIYKISIESIGYLKKQIYWKHSNLRQMALCLNIWFSIGVICIRKLSSTTVVFLTFDIRFFFRPHGTTRVKRGKIYWIIILELISKISWENWILIKAWQE
jgi:uncharacterized membrane protein